MAGRAPGQGTGKKAASRGRWSRRRSHFRAAKAAGIPIVVSFTVETDGKLPTGEALGDAIQRVDAATDNATAYYMVNCAHPDHFSGVIGDEEWTKRIRGLRGNASRLSHAELSASP